jgi:hypothetical protein
MLRSVPSPSVTRSTSFSSPRSSSAVSYVRNGQLTSLRQRLLVLLVRNDHLGLQLLKARRLSSAKVESCRS